jgi:TetR/AcrR family transcriptional repressor of lmrAB and yxaGH operons
MPKVTDTKDRMINGAKELIRKNGWGATSFKDVWEYTNTPRGSVYFHFPDGKEQLGLEVLSAVGARLVELSHAVGARTRTPETFIRGMTRAIGDEVVESDFKDGCAIVNIAAETAAGSPVLREASREAFAGWSAAMAEELEAKGVRRPEAVRTAEVLVSGIEGARVLAKTYRDRAPLDQVGETLAKLVIEASSDS